MWRRLFLSKFFDCLPLRWSRMTWHIPVKRLIRFIVVAPGKTFR
ncbi:MAG: hypothetical protein ACT6RN_15125 [Agrobacterium sp.]